MVDKSKLISSNIYSVLNPNHPNNLKEKLLNEKWSENENLKLIDLINKYGENWDTIEREFNGTRSKNEIITQFIQFPIKENVQFKVSNISSNDIKTNLFGKSEYNQGSNNSNNITSAEHDLSNPLKNARCALKVYKKQGLTAWVTYNKFKRACLAYEIPNHNTKTIAEVIIKNNQLM